MDFSIATCFLVELIFHFGASRNLDDGIENSWRAFARWQIVPRVGSRGSVAAHDFTTDRMSC